ncbi:hypothetical protein [Flaviaesturariibacter amylovorans]|uniref:Uncharacterized protein n=1 Tax=Flaviaesturariibacter amylovorans TaxID=1084520 RepID=A0ABP8GYG5_9BACT
MKQFLFLCVLALLHGATAAQKEITVRFSNDYNHVYHLALIVYKPDGTGETRVSNLEPKAEKSYTYPAGTELYIADYRQEAFAMRGNDIRKTGVKPAFVLRGDQPRLIVQLSTLASGSGQAPNR